MPSSYDILLIGAPLCIVMVLVLGSLLRTSIPGIREWTTANALAFTAIVLLAYSHELPEFLSAEVATVLQATAGAAMLLGFRRFFRRRSEMPVLGIAVVILVAASAFFRYLVDVPSARVIIASLFQAAVCLGIGVTILRSRKAWRSRYPYLFAQVVTCLIAIGQVVQMGIYLAGTGEPEFALQSATWNLLFLSAKIFAVPGLSIGAVMMVHDTMMAKAEHAATRDFLTGVWTRRALFEIAERELLLAKRTGRSAALLLLAVDNFRTINDTWGHATGDQVLVDAVLRSETAIRGVDYFARVSGEELAVLLPETSRQEAEAVAERLRSTLERSATAASILGKPSTPAYTVSVGLAMLRESDSFQELMRRANAALYSAKAAGRNRVVSG